MLSGPDQRDDPRGLRQLTTVHGRGIFLGNDVCLLNIVQ
jgi:hypothetical protein